MKILVVCNAGMSSSILVKKIAEHAKSIGEEASVQAVSSSSVADEKRESGMSAWLHRRSNMR